MDTKAERLIAISDKLERAIENITAAEATLIERGAREVVEKVSKVQADMGAMYQ